VFQEALVRCLTHLEAAQRRGFLHHFALIGGFAVAAWGVPRATHDLDFAIALGASDPRAAAEFLGGQYEAGDADDPLQGVIHRLASRTFMFSKHVLEELDGRLYNVLVFTSCAHSMYSDCIHRRRQWLGRE
jgi:hypothetical protein